MSPLSYSKFPHWLVSILVSLFFSIDLFVHPEFAFVLLCSSFHELQVTFSRSLIMPFQMSPKQEWVFSFYPSEYSSIKCTYNNTLLISQSTRGHLGSVSWPWRYPGSHFCTPGSSGYSVELSVFHIAFGDAISHLLFFLNRLQKWKTTRITLIWQAPCGHIIALAGRESLLLPLMLGDSGKSLLVSFISWFDPTLGWYPFGFCF